MRVFLFAGIIIGLTNFFLYFFRGYSLVSLCLWILSTVFTSIYFFLTSKKNGSSFLDLKDTYLITALLVIFAPLYLLSLYTIPYQVNTDELTLMIVEKRSVLEPLPDLFSLDPGYFYFPSFIYIILGWLGNLLGGINLLNLRIIHAVFGLILITTSYFFYRLLFGSKFYGFIGALLIGGNHSMLAISRIAIKDNTAAWIEILSFTFLLLGLKTNSYFYSFIGGVVAGFSFYTYYPSRVTFVLWSLFMIFLGIFYRKNFQFKILLKLFLSAFLGFILIYAPLFISTIKNYHFSMDYQKTNLILYQQGRDLTVQWFGGTFEQAYRTNVINGLTVFNNKIHDHGFIYPNIGHGFVDPLTGILIWIGLVLVLFKKQKKPHDFLMVGGLIILWLAFSFLITKSPDYTRLLVILPFAIYFVVSSLSIFEKIVRTRFKMQLLICLIAFFIVIYNLVIFGDFVDKGLREGNDVGSTGRFVESKKGLSNYNFYLSANPQYPYYSWGVEGQWRDWFGFFVPKHQYFELVDPISLPIRQFNPPFTLFLSSTLWSENQSAFSQKYPYFNIYPIKTDGSLLAIEVNQ